MKDKPGQPFPSIELPEPPWGRESDLALAQWSSESWGSRLLPRSIPKASAELALDALAWGGLCIGIAAAATHQFGAASSLPPLIWSCAMLARKAAGDSCLDLSRNLAADKAKRLPALSGAARACALRLRSQTPSAGLVASLLARMALAPVSRLDDALQAGGGDNWAARAASSASQSLRRAVDAAEELDAARFDSRVGIATRAATLGGPTAMAARAYGDLSKIATLLRRERAIELAGQALPDPASARGLWAKTLASGPALAAALAADTHPYDQASRQERVAEVFAIANACPKASFKPGPGLPTLAELADFCARHLRSHPIFPGLADQCPVGESLSARAEAEAIDGSVGEARRPSSPDRRARL